MSTLAFYFLPAHGHINPTLPVLRALVASGERVLAYATQDMKEKLLATGAEFREYNDLDFDHNNPPVNLGEMALRLAQCAEHLVPHLVHEAKREGVQYVVHDSMALWGRLAAYALDLPSICSVTTFAFPRGVPPTMQGLLMKGAIWASAARHHVALYQKLNALVARYGGPRPSFFDFFRNEAELNLVYTSRLFQPFSEKFGHRYRFCGPTIVAQSSTDPLLESLTKKPLVYASLGTLFNEREDFFRAVLQALSDFDGQVLLSVGNKIDVRRLGVIPPNALVKPFVPQLEVLKRASLFITHGGMNSVSEGLYFGVPLLLFPQAGDQEMVARRTAEVGAGRILRRRELSPQKLQLLVREMLRDERYQRNAQQIGASFRDAGGADEVLRQINAFKTKHHLP